MLVTFNKYKDADNKFSHVTLITHMIKSIALIINQSNSTAASDLWLWSTEWEKLILYKNYHKKHTHTCAHTHTPTHNRFTALWNLAGTTWVSRYQKKHSPTHTYHGHQSSLICFLHLLHFPVQFMCLTVFFHNVSPRNTECCKRHSFKKNTCNQM